MALSESRLTRRFRAPRARRIVPVLGALGLLIGAASTHARAQAGAAAANESAALEVTDETGRQVRIPQPVRRVVSLAPNLTETLFALGAGDRLAGDTDYCDYPREALSKPKVGGAINPNLEQVVALRPDLVLATKALNRRETVAALERLGIATYATDPRSVEGVLTSIEHIAEVIGAREQGAALAASLRARLDELQQKLAGRPPRRVLFVVWREPLISIGQRTFLADALRRAGAESVVPSEQDWPRVSLEEVVRLQPEYLVFASAHAAEAKRDFEALRDLPGWRDLEAVRQQRLVIVSDAVNRPAPRLVDAIFELAQQLHPAAFAPQSGRATPKPPMPASVLPAGAPCAR